MTQHPPNFQVPRSHSQTRTYAAQILKSPTFSVAPNDRQSMPQMHYRSQSHSPASANHRYHHYNQRQVGSINHAHTPQSGKTRYTPQQHYRQHSNIAYTPLSVIPSPHASEQYGLTFQEPYYDYYQQPTYGSSPKFNKRIYPRVLLSPLLQEFIGTRSHRRWELDVSPSSQLVRLVY